IVCSRGERNENNAVVTALAVQCLIGQRHFSNWASSFDVSPYLMHANLTQCEKWRCPINIPCCVQSSGVFMGKSGSRPSRIFLAIGFVLLLLISVSLGWWCYLWTQAASKLASAIAKLDREDPGWRWDDLQAKR